MDRPTFNNTLTFMVSAGMVSASLAAAHQKVGSNTSTLPVLSDGMQCRLDCGAWGMESAGSATSTPGGGLSLLGSGQGQAIGKQLAGPCPATCVDDTSPISSSSRFVHLQGAGSLTPSSVESCGLVVMPDTSQQQEQPGLQQQQQLARLLAVQRQHLEVRKQLAQLPQQRQPCLAAVSNATAGPAGKVPSAGTAQVAWQQHTLLVQQPKQQQLVTLLPQSSGGSLTSSSSLTSSLPSLSAGPDSVNSSSSAATNATAWQQLLRHQQLQLLQQQPAQQQVQLIARPLMQGSSSAGGSILVKRPTPISSLDQQPAAKKAATQAAVAAMLQASQSAAAWRAAGLQPQQQLVLLPQAAAGRPAAQPFNARLPPTGLVRYRQQQQQQQAVPAATTLTLVAAPAAVSAALAGPARVLESAQQKLLSWAGRVLNCQLQDAYLLGCHLYRRVSGQLDDMLLISLGVSASTESVTMLVSLWVASKLEGHRRQVAGASKLAAALQMLPGSITDIELHVMQRLQWQPYAGWAARLLE